MNCEQQQIIQLTDTVTIKYTGDIMDPMFKVSDVTIHLLGYKDSSKAKWFANMTQQQKQWYLVDPRALGGQRQFNEEGLYWALMSSKRQNAELFKYKVSQYLKAQRQQQFKQLQQDKEQLKIQYDESLKTGYIYGWYHKLYKSFDYIGMTTNDIKQRKQQHIQSAQNKQELPFYKSLSVQSSLNYDVQELEQVKYTDPQELLDREKYWQQHYNSIFNQKTYKLNNKEYKSIQSFEKARYKQYMQQ